MVARFCALRFAMVDRFSFFVFRFSKMRVGPLLNMLRRNSATQYFLKRMPRGLAPVHWKSFGVDRMPERTYTPLKDVGILYIPGL